MTAQEIIANPELEGLEVKGLTRSSFILRGALAAGAVYGTHGWAGVCLLGAGFGVLTLAMSAYDRLRPPARTENRQPSTISSPLPS